jgi:hypothetical protein
MLRRGFKGNGTARPPASVERGLRCRSLHLSATPFTKLTGFSDGLSPSGAKKPCKHSTLCLLKEFFVLFDLALWPLTCHASPRDRQEAEMQQASTLVRGNTRQIGLAAALALIAFGAGQNCMAQSPSQDQPPLGQQRPIISEDKIGSEPKANPPEEQEARVADGQRHGLPLETYGVVSGTKFLVTLDDSLATKGQADHATFKVTTLEPLDAGSGIYLPSGAEIRGHIDHVESAGATGRAKLWLTFDEIQTNFGALPLVAEVVSVPGDHTVRCPPKQEGLIEGRASTSQDAAEAALAAAALGAAKGVKDKNKKEALEGAAIAAIAAYMAESGRGHELELTRGTKLELELQRPLYLVKE